MVVIGEKANRKFRIAIQEHKLVRSCICDDKIRSLCLSPDHFESFEFTNITLNDNKKLYTVKELENLITKAIDNDIKKRGNRQWKKKHKKKNHSKK